MNRGGFWNTGGSSGHRSTAKVTVIEAYATETAEMVAVATLQSVGKSLLGLVKATLDEPLDVDGQCLHENRQGDPVFASGPRSFESRDPIRFGDGGLDAGPDFVAFFEIMPMGTLVKK